MVDINYIKELLEFDGENNVVYLDEYEDALVGAVERFGTGYSPLYDLGTVHQIAKEIHGEQAQEEVEWLIDLSKEKRNYFFAVFVEADVDTISETVHLVNNEALIYPDINDALVGYVYGFEKLPIALYDRIRCIEELMRQFSVDSDDNVGQLCESAEEWYCVNTIGAWVGEGTPAFAELIINEKGEKDDNRE